MAVILIVLSLPGASAWADSSKDRPEHLCSKAESADREAKEAERKSEERQRFLKGKRGITASGNNAFQNVGSATSRQSIKAKIMQVRTILPQLQQGAVAANRDKGIVPGLGEYFVQMENILNRALQGVDNCLDNPQYCSVPLFSCPPLPNIPAFNNVGSADLLRKVQESYRQGAEMGRQACLNLNADVLKDVERFKRESLTVGTPAMLPASAGTQPFGEEDLYLRRAESLKREATRYRQEADRTSGINDYCSGQRHTLIDTDTTQALVAAFKNGGKREMNTDTAVLTGTTVIDLKAGWENKWNSGKTLSASAVPFPKLPGDIGIAATTSESGDPPDGEGAFWRQKTVAAYQRADEQMELTEFIKSRPKELMKDVAIDIIENNFGSFGKSLTTGYKILSAVKTTSDEVGGILVAAPAVIASGSASEVQQLTERADRVPLNFLNSLFDDVTGKFPPPRYSYQHKEGIRP